MKRLELANQLLVTSIHIQKEHSVRTHTHPHTAYVIQHQRKVDVKKKKKAYGGRECYSIQYELVKSNSRSVHKTHFFFAVKPTSLNINILHPKVSAVPSAQASPGPHAQASPGPLYPQSVLDLVQRITVSTLHTNLFVSVWYLISHVLYGLCVCVLHAFVLPPSTSKVQL